MSISVFECQLCEVFIRHQKDIEEHIDTIKHLASYKVKKLVLQLTGNKPGISFVAPIVDIYQIND